MEYLIGIIVVLIGGVFYFKNKADGAEVEKNIAETKGRDRELAEQEAEVLQAIRDLDDGISKMKVEQEKQKTKYKHMTLKERAEAAKNRYKK